MIPLRYAFLIPIGLVALCVSPASATFPQAPISEDLFNVKSDSFLGDNFGFGTRLDFTDGSSIDPLATTGLQGFTATPAQIGGVSSFASGGEEPLGGLGLGDLFPNGEGLPGSINQGEVSQGIEGFGSFADGFDGFQINQRRELEGSQNEGDFNSLSSEAFAYVPFDILSDADQVTASFTFDVFSIVNVETSAFVTESIAATLYDISDPDAPESVDSVFGSYTLDEKGVSPSFEQESTGEDISDSFFAGAFDESPDSLSFASLFFNFEANLDPNGSYALGLSSLGHIGLEGESSALLNSTGTISFSVEVLTPGATLVLPSAVAVPEPSCFTLIGLGLAAIGARRGERCGRCGKRSGGRRL